MKTYNFKFWSIFSIIFASPFLTPIISAQANNCLVPEIEMGQALVDYRQELEIRGDAIPEVVKIGASDEELSKALRDHLCEINDVLFRMYQTHGMSFFEVTDKLLVRGNARIYPFYYQRIPNRDRSIHEWQSDMNVIREEYGAAFNIEYSRIQLSRINPTNSRIYLTADYTFFPALDDFNNKVVRSPVSRTMEMVFDYNNSERVDRGFALELRTIRGQISSREEVGYSDLYVHATAGVESYRGEMNDFWGVSHSARNAEAINGLIENISEPDIGEDALNEASFGNWKMESALSWGIDLGYAFTLDRFGKHGLDFTAGLHFSDLEATFDHGGTGIYSGEDSYSAFLNEQGVEAETRYWLGYLQSARLQASRTSLNLSIAYRHNFLNVNRRLIYLSPRLFINSSFSYSNVESVSDLGFGFVSGRKNSDEFSYGQFTDDRVQPRSKENASADGSMMFGLGLVAGLVIPVDRAGNIFFSGRLYWDYALGGSVLDHNDRQQHYLNERDFKESENYLSDFGDHVRTSRLGLSLGLSYMIFN